MKAPTPGFGGVFLRKTFPGCGFVASLFFSALLIALTTTVLAQPHPDRRPETRSPMTTERLLEMAKRKSGERYRYALEQGARIIPTSDGRSFFVVWTPDGADTATRVIATISGHASWAFDEFSVWHSVAKRDNCAVVALQWWFGGGERMEDYYSPEEMHALFGERFRAMKLGPRSVLFHGFSRGATNCFAATFFDRGNGGSGPRFFALTVANAGGYQEDYPIHRGLMAEAARSDSILAGTRWALFGGGRDKNPDRDGISAMRRTEAWIESQAGRIELVIADQDGGHGGFHRTPAHVDAVMDIFNRLTRASGK